MARQLGALAVLFLAAHLLCLPPTLEDVDSINFALGVRDFDVARHQPHPPGYPVYIALAKASAGMLGAIGLAHPVEHGLSLLSAVAGAVLVPLLFALYRAIDPDPAIGWWAMAVAVCAPLFWFTALRPLSDVVGLALVVAAQWLLVLSLRDGPEPASVTADPAAAGAPRASSLLVGGALVAGVAAGVRAQTAALTVPLLLAALMLPRRTVSIRSRIMAVVAAAAGVLVWALPMLVASGGVSAYLNALGTQAGEDFAGVVMLWTSPRPRVAINAVLYSFVWPWGSHIVGAAAVALASAGAIRAGWQAPRILALLLIAYGPYAVFHLLFHETITVRYALPLIVPVAFLVVYAAASLGRVALSVTALSIVGASLVVSLPAARAYGRDGSPAFAIFRAIRHDGSGKTETAGSQVVGMHAVMRRVEEWERGNHDARVLPALHGREWLALVEHWRQHPESAVRFVADPRRTDLILFDPHARSLDRSLRWSFPELPFVAGVRPGAADLYTMRPPGWMLDRGWSLTAEVGGVTAKAGLGPHVEPSVVWVRSRSEPAAAIVGGRNLGPPGDPPALLTFAAESGPLGTWEAAPGFFLWQVPLPAGALTGQGYVPLRVSAMAADGSGRPIRVSLEQFDLQSEGIVMAGLADGWYEPEYDPATARAWRWMSERARVWVRPVGRDVTLTIGGEDPRRYFDRIPTVRVTAAGVELSRFTPGGDFTHQVTVPAKALAATGGLVTIESDLWFTPAERGESADPRRLALRIDTVSVK